MSDREHQDSETPELHERGFSRSVGRGKVLDGGGPVDISDLPGRLIVLEGTDYAGRSTQIALLREWLEKHGFGVAHTALRRSRLAAEGLRSAKEGHTLGCLAMDLYYATDFADRLDNYILPALRAGFVVLTDRYVHSTMARSLVRGVDPDWIRDVYHFAPRPHASFYLKVNLDQLVPRLLERGTFDYWESGMDFSEERDIYTSFRRYQTRLLSVFDDLASEHDLTVVDATRSMRDVFVDVRDAMLKAVGTMEGARVSKRPGGKWIADLAPEMPVADAARLVLDARMDAVAFMVPLAAHESDVDVEHIHQLRVATRRADAALRLFRPAIGAKRRRKARRHLQTIRRAAGAARECDVHSAMLTKRHAAATGAPRAVLQQIIDDVADQREAAQIRVKAVSASISSATLARRKRRLLKAIKGGDTSLQTLGVSAIAHLARDVAAGAPTSATDIEALHELRIRGKRLRYALEIFRSCVETCFSTYYGAVEGMQEVLGDLNDESEMGARFGAYLGVHEDADEDVRRAARDLHERSVQRINELAATFCDRWPTLWAALAPLTQLDAPSGARRVS